jgi:hypothetical protein
MMGPLSLLLTHPDVSSFLLPPPPPVLLLLCFAGTLSKAVGALGGFVACSSELRALLLNKGRSVVFSTALPVPVVASAQAAIEAAARWGTGPWPGRGGEAGRDGCYRGGWGVLQHWQCLA